MSNKKTYIIITIEILISIGFILFGVFYNKNNNKFSNNNSNNTIPNNNILPNNPLNNNNDIENQIENIENIENVEDIKNYTIIFESDLLYGKSILIFNKENYKIISLDNIYECAFYDFLSFEDIDDEDYVVGDILQILKIKEMNSDYKIEQINDDFKKLIIDILSKLRPNIDKNIQIDNLEVDVDKHINSITFDLISNGINYPTILTFDNYGKKEEEVIETIYQNMFTLQNKKVTLEYDISINNKLHKVKVNYFGSNKAEVYLDDKLIVKSFNYGIYSKYYNIFGEFLNDKFEKLDYGIITGTDKKEYLYLYINDNIGEQGIESKLYIINENGKILNTLINAFSNTGFQIGENIISYNTSDDVEIVNYTKVENNIIYYYDFKSICKNESQNAFEYKITIQDDKLNYELLNTFKDVLISGGACE